MPSIRRDAALLRMIRYMAPGCVLLLYEILLFSWGLGRSLTISFRAWESAFCIVRSFLQQRT
jgi:hypothetical protein